MSKAVIFFAPGLEECEGLLCVDILRRAGVEVTIAAVGGEKIVKSARQISVVADALAEELDYTVFDACILPGGIPGVPNLKADATVRRVCRDFAAEGKVVAAICAAPTALAAFGVLNGKKATVCACVGFLPHGSELGLTLTLLVDVLSLVGLVQTLRGLKSPLPGIWRITRAFHPFN